MNNLEEISMHDIILFVDKSTFKWYVKKNESNQFCDLNMNECLIVILKILQFDSKAFFDALALTIEQKGIPIEVLESFPLRKLVVFCIENRLDYWLRLSLNWFDYIKIDKDLKERILKMQTKDYPQDIRHSLLKFAAHSNIE